jgi:hypothetical protein
MKMSRRTKFLCHITVLFLTMMSVSIAIKMKYYPLVVIWGLFAYIIAREFIDWFKCESRRRACEHDERKIAQIMKKLDRMKRDIEGTV